MYVDKKLGGVNAVQTLSRLNRTAPDKTGTIVLDFTNEASEIQEAFEAYYDRTALTQETDPNLLYDIQFQLDDFEFYEQNEIDNFANIFFSQDGTQDRLHAIVVPVIDRYRDASEEEQFDFRTKLRDFVRLYAFISQLLSLPDTDLEKFYEFARHLIRKLPVSRQRLPFDVQQNIELESYRLQQTHTGRINLQRGVRELAPITTAGTGNLPIEQIEPLSQIVQELNQRFGTDFTDDERVFIQQLETKLDESPSLQASLRVNSPQNVKLTFNTITNDLMQQMIESNFSFYKHFNDDSAFAEFLLNFLFQRYLERANSQNNTQNPTAWATLSAAEPKRTYSFREYYLVSLLAETTKVLVYLIYMLAKMFDNC